jgi:molecular chaperone GrpE
LSTAKPAEDAAASAGAAAGAADAKTPATPSVEELSNTIAELTATVEELKADRIRMLADMENVRAIARRDVDIAKAYAVQSFAKQLLEVLDTLGLALDSVKEDALKFGSKDLQSLHEGVSMTKHNLMKALNTQGIKQVCVHVSGRAIVAGRVASCA